MVQWFQVFNSDWIVVLCHHSPRWIFLAFGQDPLYSRWRTLSIYAAPPSANPSNQHSGPCHSSHPLYFWLTFASVQAKPLAGHILSSSTSALIYHICTSKGVARPCSSYHFWEKLWNVIETETMEILNGDKMPLGDNKGATGGKLYLRHDSAHFNVSSFLDLYAHT